MKKEEPSSHTPELTRVQERYREVFVGITAEVGDFTPMEVNRRLQSGNRTMCLQISPDALERIRYGSQLRKKHNL